MSASTSAPWLARLGALLAVVLVAVLAPAEPGPAAAPSYVALGDSYSSGAGTRTYLADGTRCLRSVYAYPSLIAAARGLRPRLPGLLGRHDHRRHRGPAERGHPGDGYVTISVGGNDAGFADVLTDCRRSRLAQRLQRCVDGERSYVNNTLPGALSTLYAAIRANAPNAKVVVVGYPRLFNGEDCNADNLVQPDRRVPPRRDRRPAQQPSSRPRPRRRGLRLRETRRPVMTWATPSATTWSGSDGLSKPISESYHPKPHRAGRRLQARLVSPLLRSVLTV